MLCFNKQEYEYKHESILSSYNFKLIINCIYICICISISIWKCMFILVFIFVSYWFNSNVVLLDGIIKKLIYRISEEQSNGFSIWDNITIPFEFTSGTNTHCRSICSNKSIGRLPTIPPLLLPLVLFLYFVYLPSCWCWCCCWWWI